MENMFICFLLITTVSFGVGYPTDSNKSNSPWSIDGDPKVIVPGTHCGYPDPDCPTNCQSVDSNDCRICTCTHKDRGVRQTSGGGCKPFPKSCKTECVSIDSMGCVICQCPTANSSSSSSLSSTSSKTQNNNNGCPPFPQDCKTECATIDSMGCVVCQCPSTSGSSGQSSSSSSSSSSSQGNNNGCAPFPKTCRSECATIDANGCIVCQCPSTNTMSALSSSVSSGNGINSCPPFPMNCPSTCVSLDDMGCVLCHCSGSNSTNNQPGAGVHQSGNYVVPQGNPSNQNNGGCPPLDPACPTECASIDDTGCIKCTCNHGSSTSSSSLPGGVAPSNNGGCPPLQRNCPTSCIAIDSTGCVVCPKSCSSNPQTTNTNNSTTCPPYDDYACDDVCKMINSKGCKVCLCPDQRTTTAVPGAGGCPSFDLSKCNPNCVMIDGSGCMSCQCPATSVPSGGSSGSSSQGQTTAVPGAGGCPSFDLSKCDPNCVTVDGSGCMTCNCPATTASSGGSGGSGSQGQVTAVPGAGGCPSFDVAKCDAHCVIMDGQGCLSCQCPATTVAPNSGSGGSQGQTTPVPGAGGCPSFDFAKCDPNCVVMDAQGCLSCSCTATTTSSPNGSGSTAPVTAVPGAGGCPSFDFSTCDPNCVIMDGQGCLSCQCAATTKAPSNGSGNFTAAPTTPVPGAGGCPAFDFSTCDPNCVSMDNQGCLSCNCGATTSAPSGGSVTTGPTTAVPGAGGCPSFDFSTCDPNCVKMDDLGCLSCQCAATTKAPSGGSLTAAPTTAVPGAGGCPSFDFSTCDPNCVQMDGNGCLKCACLATTSAPSSGSATASPTTAVPGAGGCPSFDFSSCDPNCVIMDGQGCLSCRCSATTKAPSGTSGTTAPTTPVPGAGGCPSFDFGKCDPNCVIMDGQGCLSCQCTATTAAPSGSTSAPAPTTAVPGSGGCPSFDFSKCDPNCVTTDGQGCLSCSCPATTNSPSTSDPNGSGTTSVPGAGGCPAFDLAKCNPSCVVMDGQGCMSCQCASTTPAPTNPMPTTHVPTTPIPTLPTRRLTTPVPAIPTTAAGTTVPSVLTTAVPTCAPVQCVPPCNKGVYIGTDHCPKCKC